MQDSRPWMTAADVDTSLLYCQILTAGGRCEVIGWEGPGPLLLRIYQTVRRRDLIDDDGQIFSPR